MWPFLNIVFVKIIDFSVNTVFDIKLKDNCIDFIFDGNKFVT